MTDTGVHVLIAGDIFPRKNEKLFTEENAERLFAPEIAEMFRKADFSVCNLEGALTNEEKKIPKCGPSLKAPPESAAALRWLGVDCAALANNHVTDYGTRGYLDTCEALDRYGISHFGGGENEASIQTHFSVTLNGIRLTFYNVAETVFNLPDAQTAGANLYDEYRVCEELKALRKECDYLIVIYHGGVEFYPYPTPWLVTRFHRMADCGADLITAQHTHCIGAMEQYKGAYLLYGQGNFHLAQSTYPHLTADGLLLELVFADGKMEVKHHPVHLAGDRVGPGEEQALSAFLDRSRRFAEGDRFEKEFSAYCEEWFVKWLLEFRGKHFWDRVMRSRLPKEKFIRYLRKSYTDKAVLRMLEHVRGEEDVEVMQRGLRDFL